MVRFKRASKVWTERERVRMLRRSRNGIRKQHPLREEPNFLEDTVAAWDKERRLAEKEKKRLAEKEKKRLAEKEKKEKRPQPNIVIATAPQPPKKKVKKIKKKRKITEKQKQLALKKARMIRCYWCSCEEAHVWTRTLKNRDSLIQHKCGAFGKVITRTVGLVFPKCSAPNNHTGPCMKLVEDTKSKGIEPPERIKKKMEEEKRIRREAERAAAKKLMEGLEGPSSTSEESTDKDVSH